MLGALHRPAHLATLCVVLGATLAHAQSAGERAWMLQVQRDPIAAEGQARAALRENPHDAIACHALSLALNDQERLVEIELQVAQSPSQGMRILGTAEVASLQGDAARAESLLTIAHERFAAAAEQDGVLITTALTAWLLSRRGETSSAQEYFARAIALADSLDRPVMQVWLSLRCGLAHSATRDLEAADSYAERALAGARALALHDWVGEAHINLSVTARLRMDLATALDHRRAALGAYRSSGNLAGQARALHYVATIHLMRGEFSRAMRFLREGLVMAEEAEHVHEAASCQGDIAALNYYLGNRDLAVQQFEAAIRLVAGDSDETDRRWRAWVAGMLNNMALIRDEQERFAEARTHYDRALAEIRAVGNPGQEAQILGNIGRCQCQSGDPDSGLVTLTAVADSARAWNQVATEAFAYSEMGACHLKRGDANAAEQALAHAMELADAEGFFAIRKDVLIGRARAARLRGDRSVALTRLEEAMAFLEGVRARSYGSQQLQSGAFAAGSELYAEALLLIDELRPEQPDLIRRAFEFIQRAKARAFLDLLAEAEIGLRCRADSQYIAREEQLLAEVGTLLAADATPERELAIARLEDELLVIENQLRADDPRYAELQYPRPVTLQEVQHTLLREDELLLEYLLGAEASFVCAITRDTYQFFRLPARALIAEQVRSILPLLQDYNLLGTDPTYLREPLAALSRDLIAPCARLCTKAERLIIAPHGILYHLPFEILFTAPISQGDEFGALPYLILGTDVSYVPTISALRHLRATHAPVTARAQILLVGDPEVIQTSGGESSVYLTRGSRGLIPPPQEVPFAREELAAIHTRFAPERVRLLQRADATAGNLRAAGREMHFDFIHITAHGIFNERRPRFSGLLLAPEGEQDDGFLAVGEAFGLDLPCRQVVLSACSSAMGEQVTGEGLVGLTRAFLYAGAASVVAALWEVSGQATAVFMDAFYGGFVDSGGDRAHALAEAKRALIKGEVSWGPRENQVVSAHPYFWSPFVLMGESR